MHAPSKRHISHTPGGFSRNESHGIMMIDMTPGTTAPSAHVPNVSGITTPMPFAMFMASRFWAAAVMNSAAMLGETCTDRRHTMVVGTRIGDLDRLVQNS